MTPKRWLLVGGVVLVAAIVAVTGVALRSGSHPATVAGTAPSAITATVERETLAARVSVAGTLTYQAQPDGSPYLVINQTVGTYTELPAIGQVITSGKVLYRVNDSPVVLLAGATPAFRALSVGVTGVDVAQLNADLVSLGYATTAQISATSASFGFATALAVAKLQAAVGVTPTGTLTLGQVVFESTAVRVTAVSSELGGSAQPGQTVAQGTSTDRQVQVALDATQQTDVTAGDTVTITLPNNQPTAGVVASVGTVATCPPTSGSATTPAAPESDSCTGAAANSTPTIEVSITPSDPAATGTWDQAPVQVGITTASVPDALVVPVTALLAQAGGGYVVEVTGAGATHRLVSVSLGLFDDADGLVQVTGSGLGVGQRVVVPST